MVLVAIQLLHRFSIVQGISSRDDEFYDVCEQRDYHDAEDEHLVIDLMDMEFVANSV